MNFKQTIWSVKKHTNEFLISNEYKVKKKSIKGSLLSIICGLIIASLIVIVQDVNPFQFFSQLFVVAFNELFIEQTMNWIAIYIIAGLGIAVGFKAGVFNIGMAGQMTAAASMSTIIIMIMGGGEVNGTTPLMVFIAFIVCLVVASLLAGVSGALKAYFNIHEVVSTIMLNWIVWYLFKFIFSIFKNVADASVPATSGLMSTNVFTVNGSNILVPLLIAGICVVIVAILFVKTTFGFKLKAVGSSQTASKYNGINVKKKIIQAMTISGAFAGVAAFINMFTLSPNMGFSVDALPSVGYDAIAVALVAFNNPLGVVFVSMLWGIIQSAGPITSGMFDMPTQISGLIFGVIIYFAAISIIFMNFGPILWTKMKYYIMKSRTRKVKLNVLNAQQAKYRYYLFSPSKSPEFVQATQGMSKEEIKKYTNDFKAKCKIEIYKLDNEIKMFKKKVFEKEINNGITGIMKRKDIKQQAIDFQSLENYTNNKLDYISFKDDLKEKAKNYTSFEKNQIHAIVTNMKREIEAANVVKEGTIGELTLKYKYINDSVMIKGEKEKKLNALKEKIVNIKTDAQLKIQLIKFDEKILEAEKTNAIAKVKEAARIAIQEVRANKSKVRNSSKTKIAELRKQHLDKVKELELEATQLNAIQKEWEEKILKAKTQYEIDKKAVEKAVASHIKKFDKTKSNIDLAKSNEVYLKLQEQIKESLALVNSIPNRFDSLKDFENIKLAFSEMKTIQKEASKTMYSIFGKNIFGKYDDNEAVNQKVKIALKFEKIKELILSSEVIYIDQWLSKNNKKAHNKILSEIKTDLVEMKQAFKTEIKSFKDSDLKVQENFDAYLSVEEKYNTKVENYIAKISDKFLVDLREIK